MKETLFPARTRCKACRKAFPSSGPLLGLFCSHKCAGREKPATKIDDAPRACKTDRGSGGATWHWKRKYDAESQISKTILNDPTSTVYWCEEKNGCLKLHIGHSRVEMTKEQTKRIVDSKQLAEVLTKAREERGLAQRDAAKAMGILWVRLKELEAGDPKASLPALFAALKFYRIKLAAVFS